MKRKLTLSVMILVLLVICSVPTVGEEKEKIELKPVLLVMDVQNIWLPMMDEEGRDSAQEKINELIALFREYNHPVIRVYHSEPGYGPEPGTEQFEFPETIDIRDDDPMIEAAEKDGRLGPDQTVVTLAVDSGMKYLSTTLYSGGR